MIECVCLIGLPAVVTLFGVKYSDESKVDYLNVESIVPARGLLAILIVLHHGSSYFPQFRILIPFHFIGYLIVALFLFFSGYGLRSGLNRKTGYMA